MHFYCKDTNQNILKSLSAICTSTFNQRGFANQIMQMNDNKTSSYSQDALGTIEMVKTW